MLGVCLNKFFKDCLFVGRRIGNVVKVVVQALHGGVARGYGIAVGGVGVFGVGW